MVCDHRPSSVMWRSEAGHFDGLICGLCKEKHEFEDEQADPGLCPDCRDRPADVTLGELVVGDIDGQVVEVREMCCLRCRECG